MEHLSLEALEGGMKPQLFVQNDHLTVTSTYQNSWSDVQASLPAQYRPLS